MQIELGKHYRLRGGILAHCTEDRRLTDRRGETVRYPFRLHYIDETGRERSCTVNETGHYYDNEDEHYLDVIEIVDSPESPEEELQINDNFKLSVGNYYRTRNGYYAAVVSYDPENDRWPFQVTVSKTLRPFTPEETSRVRADGTWSIYFDPHDYDLISEVYDIPSTENKFHVGHTYLNGSGVHVSVVRETDHYYVGIKCYDNSVVHLYKKRALTDNWEYVGVTTSLTHGFEFQPLIKPEYTEEFEI